MFPPPKPQRPGFIQVAIALVWLVNGLYCKVLNGVPRHRSIVGRILGDEHASLLTTAIGILEIGMCVWILSGIWHRLCAWMQAVVVLAMNAIEYTLARDLLLFGRLNLVLAICFVSIILFAEYARKREPATNPS